MIDPRKEQGTGCAGFTALGAAFWIWTLLAAAVSGLAAMPAAAADDLTRPIAVSPDGHFLQQPDGEPFFWLGDTAWELFHRLDREEADRYLKDRADKGFTVIQAVFTGKVDLIGLEAPNRYGEIPFVDQDPTRPNEAYFAQVDWIIERARRYGLRMALLPVWGQTFVSGGGEAQVFDRSNAEVYGRWLGERYGDKGIIWMLGGDVTPLSPVRDSSAGAENTAFRSLVDYRPVYDAMASGIEAGAGSSQFLTYHPTGGSPHGAAIPRTSLYFADRQWLDMNLLQIGHKQMGPGAEQGGDYFEWGFGWNATFSYLPVSAEYRSNPTRPVLVAEWGYEDHPIWGPPAQRGGPLTPSGFWRPPQVRGALYQALFAGATGHTYGHFSVWDFHDPARQGTQPTGAYDTLFEKYQRASWQAALNAPGAQQVEHAKALLLSRPYFTRIPDQSVIVGEAGEGERHIGATRDRTGSYLMVYLPQGRSVTVDLNKLSGMSATGWWFDPRSGTATRIETPLPTNQPQHFTPPTSGPEQDWVLVLDDASKNFPAPGSEQP
jgi:hypothetical protein